MINVLRNFGNKIHEINVRYAVPKIHQSRAVRISLLILRVYLIALVLLLVYKFVLTIRAGR